MDTFLAFSWHLFGQVEEGGKKFLMKSLLKHWKIKRILCEMCDEFTGRWISLRTYHGLMFRMPHTIPDLTEMLFMRQQSPKKADTNNHNVYCSTATQSPRISSFQYAWEEKRNYFRSVTPSNEFEGVAPSVEGFSDATAILCYWHRNSHLASTQTMSFVTIEYHQDLMSWF